MNEVFLAAMEVQKFLRSKHWSFCIIGGIALARWGQPRTTVDVDLTLLAGFGSEEAYIDILLANFESRVEDSREFALRNRVLLLNASNGTGIDVALGGFPFEERLVQRATEFDYSRGVQLLTASAEDLVILKAFAGRSQDWADIEGVLIRQGSALDWDLIVEELTPLCELKESPETVNRLLQLRDELMTE